MKDTRLLMGMPITIEITDESAVQKDVDDCFIYLSSIDERFSTYKESSEISKINAGLPESQWSEDMKCIFAECERTKRETNGYFDIWHDGKRDPSGFVKGWAIQKTADLLLKQGFENYQVDIGGDIQVSGHSSNEDTWIIGIRNPFNLDEIIKRVSLTNHGIATSGTSIRGQHIYNPHEPGKSITDIVSITVIGESITDADRFATAAFAMGQDGITFIAGLDGFEGYAINSQGVATFTSGFNKYTI
jgi:thiamine biosynthesis lipoprotein